MKGKHVKNRLAVRCLLILAALIGTEVNAGDCIKEQHGNVVCGEGQCASDQYGMVFSARAGGGAAVDPNGKVNCLGTCQDAISECCVPAR